MIKTELLIPVRDNVGSPFQRSLWLALEQRLLDFGGFSRTTGVVGAWRAENRVFRDRSTRYTVSLQSWRQLADWLAVADWARTNFRQEALYVEVAGVPEVLSG